MRKNIFVFSILMLLPVLLCGQALRGSYFLDASLQRGKLNPAFTPKVNYVTIPLIGDLSLNLNSNMGVSTFLYPKNGELYPFLNNNVTTQEFLAAMPENPRMQFSFDTDILGVGIALSKNDYISVDIAERFDVMMHIPAELFVFMKEGMDSPQTVYNFNNFSINQIAYLQASAGYKRDLDGVVPGLSVGAKVKFLMGIDKIDMKINQAKVYMSKDKWEVTSDAEGVIYGKGIDYNDDTEEDLPINIDLSSFGLSGHGFAIDLGAEYKLKFDIPVLDGLNFSASAIDLGGLFYAKRDIMKLQSKGSAAFDGLKDIGEDAGIEDGLDKIGSDFAALANFEQIQVEKGAFTGLTPKFFAGVEAPMLNNRMSFGLLYSYMYGINELTASYNVKVARNFNVGVNYSFLNNAKAVGWNIEFVPRSGVAIYAGSDYMNLYTTPQGLPVDKLVMNLKFGLQVTFGSKHFPK